MPRVNVVFLPRYNEYIVVTDEELNEVKDDDGFDLHCEVYVAEIPRTRMKYYKEAETRWRKSQRFLKEVVELSKQTPDRVRRFK